MNRAKKLLSLLTIFFLLGGQALAALPDQLKSARMTDATLASSIDNEVGNLEKAAGAILGIPMDTNISAAMFAVTASGLTKVIFQDLAGNPTAAGELARNAALLKFHDGTAARTVLTDAAAVTAAQGGTGANLGACAQGGLPYFSATGVMSCLAAGTSGLFLKTLGAAANPLWADVATGLDKTTANAASDATTNELTAYSVSIAGGHLSTNNLLRLTLIGKIKTSNATRTLTIRLKYGGTTLSTVVLKSFSATDQPLIIQGYVAGDGATNAQIGAVGVPVGAGFILQEASGGSEAAGAADSTTSQTLAVTLQLSIGEAASAWTIGYMIVEKVF
jgi:hypothetical protein